MKIEIEWASAAPITEIVGDVARLVLHLKDDFAVPWSRDIRSELVTNPGPYGHKTLDKEGGWWQRRLDQITHLTFHHTLSDSPHATADYIALRKSNQQGIGHPTTQYAIWITQTAEILLCVDLRQGLWHDSTGHRNQHLSVGLAGRLHEYRPAQVQLEAAAKVAVWTIRSLALPAITSIDQITGHMDWSETQCPGWDDRPSNAASGNWEPLLYDEIKQRL